MRKTIIFALIIVVTLLVAPRLTSIAYGQDNGDAEMSGIIIEAAPPQDAPVVDFFGGAIGGVAAGDLFYINATGSPLDMSVNLYITNPDNLIHSLRYLILKVAIYVEVSEGQWEQITSQGGIELPDTYITLQNSPVNFILPGAARYKVAIESGSYYCLPFRPDNGEIAPQFYLNVEPT